jgi:hypothetical protein
MRILVRKREVLAKSASVLLTLAATLVMARLMAAHMPFAVDPPASGPPARRTGHWQAVYILGSDCVCSLRVAEHLAQRGRLADIEERTILVGRNAATDSKLQQWGLQPARSSAEDVLRAFGAHNAPLLLFIDPDGNIRYSGGFARRSDFRDGFEEQSIWAELRAGRAVERLPAYGCALALGTEQPGKER